MLPGTAYIQVEGGPRYIKKKRIPFSRINYSTWSGTIYMRARIALMSLG
jgi:hypothetical protein